MIDLIKQQEVLGQTLKFYGDWTTPLFLAKEVAEWIEHSDVSKMVRSVDEDEKVQNIVPTLGGEQKAWFLTEDGLYEVLMQSRKPIAKEFKKQVKAILKTIRKEGRNQSEHYSPLLQELMYLESEQKRLGESLEETRKLITDMREVVALDSRCWRENSKKLIENIATSRGGLGYCPDVQAEAYQKFESRTKVNLSLRLENKKRRMAIKGGASKRIQRITKLDVIEEDLQLIEIYVAIVKEMAISQGYGFNEQMKLADFEVISEDTEEIKPLLLFEYRLSDRPPIDDMGRKFTSKVYAEDITEAALLALEDWGDEYPFLLNIHETSKLPVQLNKQNIMNGQIESKNES